MTTNTELQHIFMKNNYDIIYEKYINNKLFLNEIYNKFLKRYINRKFFFEHCAYFLSEFLFDKKNKIKILDKLSEGEYKFFSYLSNVILAQSRNFLKKETQFSKFSSKNIDDFNCNFENIESCSNNKIKKYDQKCSDIEYILKYLNIDIFQFLKNKKYLERLIIELVIIEKIPVKIVYSELINTTKSTTYRIIDSFYNEVIDISKKNIVF